MKHHMKTGGHMGDMRHGPHQLSEAHMKHHKRAAGGGIGDDDKKVKEESYAGTGSETEKEAERKKRGGRIHHGKVPMHVDGHKAAHHRLDRPGRKRGGAVGADSKPMTSAHNLTPPEGMKAQSMTARTDREDD